MFACSRVRTCSVLMRSVDPLVPNAGSPLAPLPPLFFRVRLGPLLATIRPVSRDYTILKYLYSLTVKGSDQNLPQALLVTFGDGICVISLTLCPDRLQGPGTKILVDARTEGFEDVNYLTVRLRRVITARQRYYRRVLPSCRQAGW